MIFLLLSCAGPSSEDLARLPLPERSRGKGEKAAPEGDSRPSRKEGWVGLDVLEIPEKGDGVLFACGGRDFFKHQAFDLLMEQDPRRGLQLLHVMADLALAARVARDEGVRVPRAEVERLVELGMKKDLELARRRFGPKAGLAEFAGLELGMTLEEYKAWMRKMAARQLLLSYTVVYTALREDRVQCRFMTLASREEALRVARAVRQGADFAVLARKHSLDPTASQGGWIPPFSRNFDHPAARAAFALKEGQVSRPIPGRQGDRKVWFLVYLEKRLPGKKGSFRDLEGEIRKIVRRAPPRPEEFLAFFGAARKRYGLRLFPGDNTRGGHERGTRDPFGDGRPLGGGGQAGSPTGGGPSSDGGG